MFAANHSRGHEAGGEVSAWRDCLESEERPVFACAIRFHERRGARTSSELRILLRSVPSCRPRGPCHLEGGGEERTGPWRVCGRARVSHGRTRPGHGAWVQAEGMSGHGLNELGQGASRRGAHSSSRLPLRDQPPSKKNDHGEYQRFFFILTFFSNVSVFSYQGNVPWERVVGVGQSSSKDISGG